MTVDEMIKLKKELGFSYQYISEKSGVPLGTVQKIFGGFTESPRYSTLKALSTAFEDMNMDNDMVMETGHYNVGTSAIKIDSYENKTLEDYLALPEGTRIELIDGVFYDMAAPTFVHQRIGGRDKIIKARVVGAPDLIVEVLSPSNWYMDVIRKKSKYQNAGVREYWIVLPDDKKVLVYNFEESSDPVEYTFEDQVPVAIWNGKCVVDFKTIYSKIEFLYD